MTRRAQTAGRPIRTLFSAGRLGDRTDGEILDWFEARHAEAESAFEELVARHGAMVPDVCRRVLRDPHDVDDAFQATFLVLVRRAGSIRNRDTLGGWLHRVALRIAVRARKRAEHRHEIEHALVSSVKLEPSEHETERAEAGAGDSRRARSNPRDLPGGDSSLAISKA